MRERIERREVESRIESDHMPMVVWIKELGRRRNRRGKLGKKIWVLSEEERREFRKELGELGQLQGEQREVEEKWGKLKSKLQRILYKGNRGAKGKRNKRGWFDEECKEEKRRVRKELRR